MSSQTHQSTTVEKRPPRWASNGIIDATNDLYNITKNKNSKKIPLQQQSPLSPETISTVEDLNKYSGKIRNQESSAEKNLAEMAKGKYLKEGNPYFRERLQREIENANNLIQSQFSGAGRYGSVAHADAIGKNSQNMLLAGLEKDYAKAMDAMLAANSQIDNMQKNKNQAEAENLKNRLASGQLIDKHNQQQKEIAFKNEQNLESSGLNNLKSYAEIMKLLTGHLGTTDKETVKSEPIVDKIITGVLKRGLRGFF